MNAVDFLTGVLVQKAFMEAFKRETDRGLRYRHSFTLLLCEIQFITQSDEFDVRRELYYGVLKQVAPVLTEGLRKMDIAGRYGGEYLVFVLPETTLDGGEAVGERMRSRVEKLQFRGDDRVPMVKVVLNVGYAGFPVHGKSAPDLLAAAQKALQVCRAVGGNQVIVSPEALYPDFDPPPPADE